MCVSPCDVDAPLPNAARNQMPDAAYDVKLTVELLAICTYVCM